MRAKDIYRKVAIVLLPPIGALLMRVLFASYRIKYHIDGQMPKDNAVFIGWHGELFVLPLAYRQVRKNYNIHGIISHHFDGAMIARVLKLAAGIGALRGSSTRGAKAVLIQAIRKIEEGDDIMLTPDGPKGPRHRLQHGMLSLAKRAGGRAVIFTMQPQRYWQFKSWDRFMIPKPFTKIDIYIQVQQLQSFDDKSAQEVEKKMLRYAI